MQPKMTFLVFIVLVLGLAGNTAFATVWNNWAGDRDRSNPGNWNNGIPEPGDDAIISSTGSNSPIFDENDTANGAVFFIPVGFISNSGELYITGGTLSPSYGLAFNKEGDSSMNSTVYMSGGTLEAGGFIQVGRYASTATFNMTGGTINVSSLQVPASGWALQSVAGVFNLDGGVVSAGVLYIAGPTGDRTGVLNITEGTLILSGDKVSFVNGCISDGAIVIYPGGSGRIYTVLDYDLRNAGKTTLSVGNTDMEQAWYPVPLDAQLNVGISGSLSWTPGDGAVSHDVYFGADFDDVNNASDPDILPGRGRQGPNSFDYSGLEYNTTYYWRIDEFNGTSAYKGQIWSFTTPVVIATGPFPTDEASDVDRDVVLRWSNGYGAISHDVYLGTDFNDVNDRISPDATVGVNSYDPGFLEFDTTYYWRIDEYDGSATHRGDVWSFSVGSGAALNPVPSDGANNEPRNAVLSWTEGWPEVISHDVYFGTNFNDVNDSISPLAVRDVTYYRPGLLETDTTYYWRIDEYDGTLRYKGNVWSFTTASEFVPIPDIISRWEFEEGTGSNANDSAGGNHGTLIGDTSWVAGKIGIYGLDFDGDGDYVSVPHSSSLNIDGFTDSYTFSLWVKSSTPTAARLIEKYAGGTLQYPVSFQVNSTTCGAYIYDGSKVPGVAFGNIWDGQWHHLAFVVDNSTDTLYAYLDGSEVDNTTNTVTATTANSDAILIGDNYSSPDRSFNGQLDDIRAYNRALTAAEVQQLSSGNEGGDVISQASNPNPNDGVQDVLRDVGLGWVRGYAAVSHDVYLGTDFNDVNDSSSPAATTEFTSYDPGFLEFDMTYYWRVDANDRVSIHKGDVWSFTIGSGAATNSQPASGTNNILGYMVLCWSKGWPEVISHDVYLGTDFNDVNDGIVPVATIDVNNYDPCELEPGTTYYWRIDEFDGTLRYKGNVWSFATSSEYVYIPNLVAHWEFEEGVGSDTNDLAGSNDGTLYGDTSWVTGKVGSYGLDCDGAGDYVTIADDDSLTPGNQITIAFWLYNRGGQTAGIYKYASCPDQLHKGSPGNSRAYHIGVSDSTGKAGLAVFSAVNTSDSIISINTVPLNEWHHVAATFDQGQAAIYIDGQLDNTKTMSVTSIMNDDHPLIIGGYWEYCTPAFVNRLNGIIDDVRIYNRALTTEEVVQWYFGYGFVYLEASNPNPGDGARHVAPDVVLGWSPGYGAISHDVYFGTDFNDVNDSIVPTASVGVNYYDPCGLEFETTYYWRVDANDGSEMHRGSVWSFTIASLKATDPLPADMAAGVDPCSTILSWSAGYGAISRDVYFGTSFSDVNDAVVPVATIDVKTYDPCGLEAGKSYYWRIDENDGTATYRGDIWRFVTEYPEHLAFPGAQGYGAYAAGGRGGDVYHVTTLSDYDEVTETPIAGSLRYGIKSATGPRTIVFDVSGYIDLVYRLGIDKPYLTIAGQTAPGDGITVRKHDLRICYTHDIIMRYLRVRTGKYFTGDQYEDPGGWDDLDCLSIDGGVDVILDHISTSWSLDECMSIVGPSDNVTVQWCTMTEPLNYNDHSKCSMLRPCINSRITHHHNLYGHTYERLTRFGNFSDNVTTRFDWYNNIAYNWGSQCTYSLNNTSGWSGYPGGGDGEFVEINMMDNYFIAGPNTAWNYAYQGLNVVDHKIWAADNFWDDDLDGDRDGSDLGWAIIGGDYNEMPQAFDINSPYTTESAGDAYNRILDMAGASLIRDAVDERIISEVNDCSGIVPNTQDDVGGWPVIAEVNRPADFDTDGDGMPNYWELPRGFDANDANDRNDDLDGDGYTNLEEYLNYLTIQYGTTPGDFDNDDDSDIDDFIFFVDDWLVNDPCYVPAGDLYGLDNFVDWRDFAFFAESWSE